MCTAISYNGKRHYFGRTLDVTEEYDRRVVITPRNYRMQLLHEGVIDSHYAFVGTASVISGSSLYYDGVNERGICVAGLNLPHSTKYGSFRGGRRNIAAFELMGYILAASGSLSEVREILSDINITDDDFSADITSPTLHFLIADKTGAITVECVSGEVKIYENSIGVLTNEPEFPWHERNLSAYATLSNKDHAIKHPSFGCAPILSKGIGSFGLPGDFTSQSRFVRSAFLKNNCICEDISDFLNLFSPLVIPKGACEVSEGVYFKTSYISLMDSERGIYYYSPNRYSLHAVDMRKENLEGEELIICEMAE